MLSPRTAGCRYLYRSPFPIGALDETRLLNAVAFDKTGNFGLNGENKHSLNEIEHAVGKRSIASVLIRAVRMQRPKPVHHEVCKRSRPRDQK